jgi:hypothetical protein
MFLYVFLTGLQKQNESKLITESKVCLVKIKNQMSIVFLSLDKILIFRFNSWHRQCLLKAARKDSNELRNLRQTYFFL